MEEIPILQDIVTILGSSLVVLLLSHRLRVPTIVGFLITGAIIGPYGLGLIQSTGQVGELADIGITKDADIDILDRFLPGYDPELMDQKFK